MRLNKVRINELSNMQYVYPSVHINGGKFKEIRNQNQPPT